jgi:two-component system, NarL family, nitrate/nitrite response regulator NarL
MTDGSNRIRVAVVDDHPLFREGVAHVIRNSGVLKVIGEGASAADAIRIAKDDRPDIILLDVHMPGGGIEAARAIARDCPLVKLIMLTVSESEDDVAQALETGAHGYVLKGTGGSELVSTLCAVARGESYVTPALAARLLTLTNQRSTVASHQQDLPELTERENQILDHVARGLTNKEIAKNFDISEKTVKHYMTSILQKLNARNRVEAVLTLQKRVQNAAV